jgi:hypothetical protein
MTETAASAGAALATPARKRAARTTSRVVTPKRRAGSKTPAFSRVAATMGTVELTGLEMTRMHAVGATRATADARSRTIEALVYATDQNKREKNAAAAAYVEEVITGHLEEE